MLLQRGTPIVAQPSQCFRVQGAFKQPQTPPQGLHPDRYLGSRVGS